MAGDWIKLEKCSPNKPEVMRLARMWGIPQDQAFGVLARFWIWLDDACVDGVVDGVASHEIDDMMRFPGFAQGLRAVGWLEIDEDYLRIRVPNFDKHNSETSKKRALKSDRQARWRAKPVDASVDATPSTRKEKKRIDTSLRSVSKRATLNAPTEEHEVLAEERGVSCQAEFQKYRDWLAASGRRHKDEVAGFRNWLRNARPPDRAVRQASNMDILTGRAHGFAKRVDSAVVLTLPSDLRESGADDVEGRGPARSAGGVG